MIRFLFLFIALILSGEIKAQIKDPVIMVINGKPITRSAFEYSYNKNRKNGDVEPTSVSKYAQMFIDYKLKVAAAEADKMDTLKSFKNEFKMYRDMQLMPYLIDSVYIDSIAHQVYDTYKKQLKGKDLLQVLQIFIPLSPNAPSNQVKRAKALTDSLYDALKKGDDFATLAKRYSKDSLSAREGGLLPWFGPGVVLKPFEDKAYSLSLGEISQPVRTSIGFHIIKLINKKPLESFHKLSPQIYANLKSQGLDQASARHKIKQLLSHSKGKLTRESILDSIYALHKNETNLKNLIQEYYDGLLLFAASKKYIWDKAANDSIGLEQTFKKNFSKYKWKTPHFKGFIFHCSKPSLCSKVKRILKKEYNGLWKNSIRSRFNSDTISVVVSGPYFCKKGEDAYVDQYVFHSGIAKKIPQYPYTGYFGKVFYQPKSYKDVKPEVLEDLQKKLEKNWVNKLRQNFQFSINKAVLKTVNNH